MNNKSYRILYLCADPGVPIFGRKGCSTHVRESCHFLSQRGHSVFLLAANPGEDNRSQVNFQLDFFNAHKTKALGADFRLILDNLTLRRRLLKICREFKPQIIYERYSLYSVAGELIARKLKIPRILEINAPLATEIKDRLHFPRLAQLSESHIFKNADYFIVVSPVLREQLLSLGIPQARIVIQPTAIDPEMFNASISPPPADLQNRCNGKVVIGYVGNLAHYHRLKFLFDIAQNFKARQLPVLFLIIGGEQKRVEKYKNYVAQHDLRDYFIFTGSLNYKEVPAFLSMIDIGIIPHCYPWTAPIKMFEYAALKKPIIAPDYPAMRHFFHAEAYWLLFPPEDVSAIEERIMKLLSDTSLRKKIGELNYGRLLSGFTPQHYVAQVENIISQLLS